MVRVTHQPMPEVLSSPQSLPFSPKPRSNWVLTLTPNTTGSSATPRRISYSTSTTQGWRWNKITASATLVHFKITYPYHLLKSVVFCGRNFFCSSSSLAFEGKNQGHNRGSNSRGMGATYTSDDDSKDKHYQDGKKPPPSNSNKLLTLLTILTIGASLHFLF